MLARSLINVDGDFLEDLIVLESLGCGDPATLGFLLVILLDLSPLTSPMLECLGRVLIEPHRQRDSG